MCSKAECSPSSRRENHSNIDCSCPREKKIHILKLDFIRSQRKKTDHHVNMEMGSIDYTETSRQIATKKRGKNLLKKGGIKKNRMKSKEVMETEEKHCHDIYQLSENSAEENEGITDDNSREPSEALPKKGKYDTRDIFNIALPSIRQLTGLCEDAKIAIATWNRCRPHRSRGFTLGYRL